MTLAEVNRAIKSKQRTFQRIEQEKASFDYLLADLIGKSVARVYSSSNKYPEISEAYPTLFNNDEIQEKKQQSKAELSAARFKQFANAYNEKFNKEAKEKSK